VSKLTEMTFEEHLKFGCAVKTFRDELMRVMGAGHFNKTSKAQKALGRADDALNVLQSEMDNDVCRYDTPDATRVYYGELLRGQGVRDLRSHKPFTVLQQFRPKFQPAHMLGLNTVATEAGRVKRKF